MGLDTALVLQGGGALGAYEVGVVKRLHEDPDFQPQMIAGVSIGAINGAVLVAARGNPLETLLELWRSFSVRFGPFQSRYFSRFAGLFGIPGFFKMRDDFWNAPLWTGFYDIQPLQPVLERLIDFKKLHRCTPRLIVTATDVKRGKVEVFDSDFEPITPEHLFASGALPPSFPPVKLKGTEYWDGGILDNAPLAPVIDRLVDYPGKWKRIVAVELFPVEGEAPHNMLEVFDRMFEVIFLNRLHFDHHELRKINQFVEVIDRIDRELPANSSIREMPGYQRLKRYRLIDDAIFIQNRDPEVVFGPFDFSMDTLDRRMESGYRDADVALSSRSRSSPMTEPVRHSSE